MNNKLNIGDMSGNGQITIIDEDRLCYIVKSTSRGAIGIRTIAKALLSEYVDFFSKNPNASANDARDVLSGNSNIDKFEYGYSSTLKTMAQMVLGQSPIINTQISYQKYPIRISSPLQQIFYGAPGTGKSHEIKQITQGQKVIRTTFHPDSDYSTFVGAYKPTMEDSEVRVVPVVVNNGISLDQNKGTYWEKKIVYKFVKQAFLKAYLAAWKKYHVFNSSLANTLSSTSNTAPIITNVTGQPTTPYKRTGNFGSNTSFSYTTEKGATLTPDEENRLNEVDNFDFPFDGIANFGELHNKKIKVVITDSPTVEQQTRYKKHITITAQLIRDLYNKWSNRNALNVEERLTLEKIITLILNALGLDWMQLDQLKNYQGPDFTIEIDDNADVSLLGLYVSSEKTIFLFKNNIGDNEALLCATYIHEMFHAYYDSMNQHVPEIEEPIVENNTLCFLELFNKDYFDSYKDEVNHKKNCLAINYYGFGAYLYENRSLDWMQLYGNSFNKIQKNSSLVNQYNNMFANIYPFGKEQQTQNLLYAILNPQFGSLTSFNQNHGFSSKHIYQFLIIEEINRGNCAQIFGDIFQLLDRQDNGFSSYPIEADADIQQAIKTAFEEEDEYKLNGSINVEGVVEDYTSNYGKTLSEDIQEGRILLLPPNLFIWATMNTSDQSLFPIDSAFKRRWEWKYMPIGYKNKDWTIKIGEKEYNWVDFQRTINDKIYSVDNSEDKQLGDFFVDANRTGTIITADTLLNKILFYIWNDVCKDDPDQIFRWKDYKDDKEKSIRFSDFFDNDRDKKLQGLMCFLKVNAIGESEETNETGPSLTTEESEMSENSVEKDDEVTP